MHFDTVMRHVRLGALVLATGLSGSCLISTAPPIAPPKELGPAKISANEQLIISQLRAIKNYEELYFSQHNKYGTIDDLKSARLLNQDPQSTGYYIDVYLDDDDATKYYIQAVPRNYGPGGRRSFYMDQTGKILGDDHNGGAASESDPPAN